MVSEIKKQLESLVADLIDGNLDAGRREELNFLLRDSEPCRSRFNALMDIQDGMTHLAGMTQDASSVLLSRGGDAVSTAVQGGETSVRSIVLPWTIALASLAALFIMAITLLRPMEDPSLGGGVLRNSGVASKDVVVVESSAAEYFDDGPIIVGQSAITDAEYVLTSGTVKLLFPDGAMAILEAPNVFTVLAADRLRVKLGRCSVYAPDGAEGFCVQTPQTEVVDLGTRFSVLVDEVGATDVQVIEGAAEVHQTAESDRGDKLVLTNGQARRFSEDRENVGQEIPFEASIYRTDLPDRVIAFQTSSQAVDELESLTVQRNRKPIQYSVDDLIRIEITSFVPEPGTLNVADIDSGVSSVRELLETDRRLSTGLINPGGSKTPLEVDPVLSGTEATPGLGFRFQRPVVNGPGPDVVLFDLQSKVDSPVGDGFHVSPLRFFPGLRSHTIDRYDITIKSSSTLATVDFELMTFPKTKSLLTCNGNERTSSRKPSLQFYVIATGIDLSDLGVALGDSVNGLFIQDDANDNRQVDPVFIAGFPAPENVNVWQ